MVDTLFVVLAVIAVAVVVLVYFEAVDVGEMIVGLFQLLIQLLVEVVRLVAGLLFALGTFVMWLATRRNREKKPAGEQPRDG